MNRQFYKFFALILFGCLACSQNQSPSRNVVFVKLLPNLSNLPIHEQYYQSAKSLYPNTKIERPSSPMETPNYHFFLNVSLDNNGIIKLNSENVSMIQDTSELKTTLTNIFQQRVENKVYLPETEIRKNAAETEKIERAVVIKASLSSEYGDVFKIIKTVKETGAEPIVLQIDELPQ